MRYSLVLLLVFLAFQSFAQPVNDDCDGLIDLGIAPYCPDVTTPGNEGQIYNNVDATATDIGFGNNPSCFNGGTAQRDVWFAFTTNDTIFDYTLTIMGIEGPDGTPAIINPQVALYRGSCGFDQLAELRCASAEAGENTVSLNVEGLTPNITYFLRVNDYSNSATPNAGAFSLCIDEIDPIYLITEGSSSSCSGELYDSGGPDGDYENNEDNTFVICPNEPNQCITFGLTYYNIEFGTGDQLVFYDGNGTAPETEIASIGGFDFSGGGAVCFEAQASSGCMTLQFISDSISTFEGFAGQWECSSQACDLMLPISVDTSVTNQQIADALSSPQTPITITSINCDIGSYATFLAGDNSDLGLEKGLLLTTGAANNARGPNLDQGGTNPFSSRGQPGDADLDILSNLFGNGATSLDACIIELDVFANTDELVFEYVFGSEEYPEFVNQTFNDIFAFLISGPGIVGIPDINNQLNIATLPDGNNTFVEINSVNNLENWEYYRNNALSQSLQYDGLTSDYLGVKKSLTARATVIPCNTYHLKLAIADRGDDQYDSGVFVSDIRAGTPQIDVVFNSGIDYLIELCTDQPDDIIFTLSNDQDEAVTYNLTITGTATQGEDYILDVPSELTFQPGMNALSFPITVLTDLDDTEGIENIIITLTNDFGCGTIVLATLEIELHNIFQVHINAGIDTARYCPNTSIALSVEGGAQYFWSPSTIFDDPLSPTPVATPTEDGWVWVEGQIGLNCTAIDSIYLLEVNPLVDIFADTLNICLGDSIRIAAVNNTNGEGFSWLPATNILDANSPVTSVFPDENMFYFANVVLSEGCMASDSVFIDVDFLNIPTLISDTTICQHSSVILSTLENPDISSTTYSWIPEDGIAEPNTPSPVAFPDTTTVYQLISTSNNGVCADTSDMVTITVLPADVTIQGLDTIFLCIGESTELTAITSTGNNQNFFWSPDDGSLSSTTELSVIASPLVHTTYYTNLTIGECMVMDSVVVRLDSLPLNMQITADPDKDPYCQGELISLTSPIYEPAIYPDILHEWTGPGFETLDSLYNMILTTVDTFTYNRRTVNGGCVQDEEITLNVVVLEAITIVPANATICQGESVNLLATLPQGGDFSWSPTDGLSCSDCLDPVASPNQTTTYVLTVDVSGCEIEQSVTITVGHAPTISVINDQLICAGESIQLNIAPAEPDATYTWTAQNDPDFSSNEANLTVSPSSTETYFLSANNACGNATDQVTIMIVQGSSLTGVGENQTLCFGESLSLNAVLEPEPDAADELVWIYDGESELGASATFTAGNSGFAVFNYTYGPGENGCELIRDSIFITVLPAPQIDLVADTVVCSTDNIDIMLNNGIMEEGVTYSWSSNDDPGFNSQIANPSVSPTFNTTYVLVASNGSCSVRDSVSIEVLQPATLTAGEDQIITQDNTTITLDAVVTNGGGDETIEWEFDGMNSGTGLSVSITVNLDELPNDAIITYMNNCETLTDTIRLLKLDVEIPNIFSPNGDELNSIFKPFYGNTTVDLVEVYVYNRWGQQVFESTNPNNPGWDGTVNGEPAPSDVYIYLVKVGMDGIVIEKQGSITLMR